MIKVCASISHPPRHGTKKARMIVPIKKRRNPIKAICQLLISLGSMLFNIFHIIYMSFESPVISDNCLGFCRVAKRFGRSRRRSVKIPCYVPETNILKRQGAKRHRVRATEPVEPISSSFTNFLIKTWRGRANWT